MRRLGSRIEVANQTGRDVTVLGYAGEPYLRITPEAVYANTRSPATAINDSKSKIKTLPTDARVEAKAAPSWKRIGDEPISRWHDHRSHWTSSGLPPAAEAEPGSPHRLRNWTVELVADRTPVKVTGGACLAVLGGVTAGWRRVRADRAVRGPAAEVSPLEG